MMEKRTEISTLGEFGLIDKITENFVNHRESTRIGVGDDAAVIDGGTDYLLLSTDMLVEGVHFDLSYMPIQHLGYKSISINVSDIAAMNGVPHQVVVSLGLSNRFSVEAIEKLYEGIAAACSDFNVDLVGGDTTSSPSGLIISVSVTGRVPRDKVALRSKAEKGILFAPPAIWVGLTLACKCWSAKSRCSWPILICNPILINIHISPKGNSSQRHVRTLSMNWQN